MAHTYLCPSPSLSLAQSLSDRSDRYPRGDNDAQLFSELLATENNGIEEQLLLLLLLDVY